MAKDLWNQNLASLTSGHLHCYSFQKDALPDVLPDALCPSLRSVSLNSSGCLPEGRSTAFVLRHASQLCQLYLHSHADAWLPSLVRMAPSFTKLTTLSLKTLQTFDINKLRALLLASTCLAELHIEASVVSPALIDLAAPYLVSLECQFEELSAALLASLKRCTKLAHLRPIDPSEAHLPLYLAVGAPLQSLVMYSFDANAAGPLLDSITRTCTNLTDLTICVNETLLSWPIATLRKLTIEGWMRGEAAINFLSTLVERYPRLRSLTITFIEDLPSRSALMEALYAAEAGGLERLECKSPLMCQLLLNERCNFPWLDIVLREPVA